MTEPMSEPVAVEQERYLGGRFDWAAPGDQQEDAWLVRFCDKDCGEAIFTGPDAEREAWEHWNRYAPAYNIYVFRLARLTATPPAPERRSTPEEQASAIAHGHALDAEDGGYPAPESRVPTDQAREALERMVNAVEEFVECARLRGDNDLPHPADDPKLWTARMADDWAELEAVADEADATRAALATFDQAVPSRLVEAAIDIWHESDKPLHEFLGWTEEEYAEWVADPTKVPRPPAILAALSPVPASAYQVMRDALDAALAHFGPFAEITVNGRRDPEDVRVVALMNEALTKSPLQENHFHCPNGCEKVVFEHEDRPVPTCVRCGAEWVRCDEDICHLNAKSPPQETAIRDALEAARARLYEIGDHSLDLQIRIAKALEPAPLVSPNNNELNRENTIAPAPPQETVEAIIEPHPIVAEVLAEVEKATRKFPTWPTRIIDAGNVVSEEAGELAKACLQVTYEKHKETMAGVRTEAIQTAAMCLRFLASMDRYDTSPGEQHEQPPFTAVKPEQLTSTLNEVGND